MCSLQYALAEVVERTALRNAVWKLKFGNSPGQLQLSSCPGKKSCLSPGSKAFLSLGSIYYISKSCILQLKPFSFFPSFYFHFFFSLFFFSLMDQMGFSLGSLFAALALPVCLGCSFSSFSKASGVVGGLI